MNMILANFCVFEQADSFQMFTYFNGNFEQFSFKKYDFFITMYRLPLFNKETLSIFPGTSLSNGYNRLHIWRNNFLFTKKKKKKTKTQQLKILLTKFHRLSAFACKCSRQDRVAIVECTLSVSPPRKHPFIVNGMNKVVFCSPAGISKIRHMNDVSCMYYEWFSPPPTSRASFKAQLCEQKIILTKNGTFPGNDGWTHTPLLLMKGGFTTNAQHWTDTRVAVCSLEQTEEWGIKLIGAKWLTQSKKGTEFLVT